MTVDSAATRETNKQTLRRAMNGISTLDADAIRAELHDAAAFELPFEPAVPDCDRESFLQLLSMMFVMFKKFDITITDIYDLLDPDMLIARYRSDAEGRDKPVAYQNEYIGIFRFNDGKLTYWREYNNPEASHAAIAKFADDAPAVSA
ncbi:MAG: nuclear transport factor 2 family protein [Mycobacterium sp.]|jgi:ketosteroid isomerase-like protein|uniref:nuclear transport factor 2 family protein n=1 Tax=Mycobacterium sp. TaxID=1785 RepID=UPI00389B0677